MVATACVQPPEPPPGTIPKDKMIAILVDIHIAEAKVGSMGLHSVDSMQVLYKSMKEDVFRKHRVDSTAYNKSYNFYLENTKYLDEIYAAVVDSLSLKENLVKTE